MAANKDLRVTSLIELPKGEDAMWMMIRKLGAQGSFAACDVATFTDCRTNVALAYMIRLEKAGFIRRSPEGRRKVRSRPQLFELARDAVFTPRVLRDGTEKPELLIQTLWRSMRMLKTFTVQELADIVEEAGREANVPSIRSYVCALASAGVLEVAKASKQRGWHSYRLVRSVGPKAPQVLAARIVFDPNAKATIGVADAREVAP